MEVFKVYVLKGPSSESLLTVLCVCVCVCVLGAGGDGRAGVSGATEFSTGVWQSGAESH